MRNNNLIQEEINRARHYGVMIPVKLYLNKLAGKPETQEQQLEPLQIQEVQEQLEILLWETWKNAFKTRMASNFGPPGATRLNQITQARKPQALRFLVKTKAKLVNKRNNVNAGSAHYTQLTYKIDNVTMIARNMYQTVI